VRPTTGARRTEKAGTRLLERDAELGVLESLLARARAGDGGVVVIEGPPGIGKTGLIKATARLARLAGFIVLTAVGVELEMDFAFGMVRQLFEPVIAELEPDERSAALAGAAGLAGPLVDPTRAKPATGEVPGDVFPALHGLYWLCSNLSANRPLLIAVDDAHWGDSPSLRWLHYLAGRVDGLPVLLAVATRSTKPEAPVELIEAIKSRPEARLVQPGPLSPAASGALLERVFGSKPEEGFVRAAHEATAGNPFLLEALARSLVADGIPPEDARSDQLAEVRPEAVRRSVLARLARLPEGSRAVARAVAVLADGAQVQRVADLAGLSEREVSESADLLVGAGLLERERSIRFTHPIIRSTVYSDLPVAERSRQHKRAARLLADEEAPPQQIAAHLLVVEPEDEAWVVEELRVAARESFAGGAPDAAGAYLRRALAEPPEADSRAAVLGELGLTEAALADPAAEQHMREASAVSTSPAERISLARSLAFLLTQLARPGEAAEVLTEAIDVVPEAASELRLFLTADLLTVLTIDLTDGKRKGLEIVHAYAGRLDGETPAERAVLAALSEWRGRFLEASREETIATARLALGGDRLLDEGGAGSLHLAWALYALIFADGFDEAERVLGLALSRARAGGSLFVAGQVLALAGLLAFRRGSLVQAEVHERDSLDFALRIQEALTAKNGSDGDPGPPPAGFFLTLGVLVQVLVDRGDLAGAAEELERLGMVAELPPVATTSFLVLGRGQLRLAEGNAELALADAVEAGRRGELWGVRSPGYEAWRSLAALAHLRLGQRSEARRLAAEEVDLAERLGAPRALGIALRCRGLAAGGSDGLEDLRRAVEVLEPSGARLEYARALAELGAALRRANRRSDAREPLRLAIDLARRCDAVALAEQAHDELRATGARPRRLELSGIESLTPRERQLAEMAADGQTNPEIAQALFVTRRTVETHLTSVYRKLDISSREELARALGAR
jgi:DNA-binding CsgD family transcriptional regulator